MIDPAAKTSALSDRNSLLAALEAARAELDGVRRWFAFTVAASGGISIPDKALMLDAPAIERTYDPVTFTTTFRALLATTPPTAVEPEPGEWPSLFEIIEAMENRWPRSSEGWDGFEQAREWALDAIRVTATAASSGPAKE